MAGLFGGIGAVIEKITQWIPGRVEALKNEKARLLNERKALLKQPVSARNSDRIIRIDVRLQQINEAIGNHASN